MIIVMQFTALRYFVKLHTIFYRQLSLKIQTDPPPLHSFIQNRYFESDGANDNHKYQPILASRPDLGVPPSFLV